jgi:hypothetical protein
MACRVPFDICSGCGNKAKNRKEYCTGDSCKYGGCTDNLSKVIKVANDTHQLHVDNPDPTWFDISLVFRPADRIAWGNKADYLGKAASDGGYFDEPSIKLAEDLEVVAPLEVILYQESLPGTQDPKLSAQIKLAYALDKIERSKRDFGGETLRAFSSDIQQELDLDVLGTEGTTKFAEGLGALADQKVILPLRQFLSVTETPHSGLSDIQAHLPGIYGRMVKDGSLEERLCRNKYALSEKLASAKQRNWAKSISPDYSLSRDAVNQRCIVSVIRQHSLPDSKTGFWIEKSASDNETAEEAARQYAIYKLAALHRIASFDEDFPLTARLCVSQNHVS